MSDQGEPRAVDGSHAVPNPPISDETPQAVTEPFDLDALRAEVNRPDPWLAEFLAGQARDLDAFLASLPPLDLTGLVDLADLDLPRLD